MPQTTTDAAVPVAPDLFTWPADRPALIAAKGSDGKLTFPYRRHRLVNGVREEQERVELPRRGTLWTFTTQAFRPTSPPYSGDDDASTFQPFTVGYIELPGALRVEARLTEPDPDKLTIGQEMELVIVPFAKNAQGVPTVMYAFAPATSEEAAE
ncbi:Zn-ribbon domain-containing OB-fold protein [Gordonia alkanivorans]|uniref:Zn-ribbon domain-containing OB-fold protein n=1 Tax=Gordonia alkanivorans TaxID=84096 RepID=UPI002448D6AD|nr:OB-fold domain-containing protein [Gordonia alkanivorans]MDH3047227.1 OB-fold domain-containing protein [Gordonia alkanivorans]